MEYGAEERAAHSCSADARLARWVGPLQFTGLPRERQKNGSRLLHQAQSVQEARTVASTVAVDYRCAPCCRPHEEYSCLSLSRSRALCRAPSELTHSLSHSVLPLLFLLMSVQRFCLGSAFSPCGCIGRPLPWTSAQLCILREVPCVRSSPLPRSRREEVSAKRLRMCLGEERQAGNQRRMQQQRRQRVRRERSLEERPRQRQQRPASARPIAPAPAVSAAAATRRRAHNQQPRCSVTLAVFCDSFFPQSLH